MGKTRAECSQNAYMYKCFFKPLNTNFSKFFVQIWHFQKTKKQNPTLFFRILRSVGRGQHNKFFFWPYVNKWVDTRCSTCIKQWQGNPSIEINQSAAASSVCEVCGWFQWKDSLPLFDTHDTQRHWPACITEICT